jgi:hypothetical protein
MNLQDNERILELNARIGPYRPHSYSQRSESHSSIELSISYS